MRNYIYTTEQFFYKNVSVIELDTVCISVYECMYVFMQECMHVVCMYVCMYICIYA